MTATDELRRMLDERGVEYTEDRGYREFFWDFGESGRARASAIGTKGLVQMIVTGITPAQAIEATLGPREQPPYDELIEALRRDWDIEASWDGLRRFWYVGLTDEGVRKRDEREATLGRGELERENAKLRELVRIAGTYCVNGYCGKDDGCPLRLTDYDCQLLTKARKLGVEVDG